MKTCPKCNMSGIPDEASFCPKCGAKIVCKKKDSQQLLKEALSAWEKYPNKPKHKNIIENYKASTYVLISSLVLGGIMFIGILIKDNDIDGALKVGLLFLLMGGGLMLLMLPILAIIGYIQDKRELKNAKNAFVEKYIQANEYE